MALMRKARKVSGFSSEGQLYNRKISNSWKLGLKRHASIHKHPSHFPQGEAILAGKFSVIIERPHLPSLSCSDLKNTRAVYTVLTPLLSLPWLPSATG